MMSCWYSTTIARCGSSGSVARWGLTSVGMFGPHGGWGLPIAPPTLMVTVGGITTKPRYVDEALSPASS